MRNEISIAFANCSFEYSAQTIFLRITFALLSSCMSRGNLRKSDYNCLSLRISLTSDPPPATIPFNSY